MKGNVARLQGGGLVRMLSGGRMLPAVSGAEMRHVNAALTHLIPLAAFPIPMWKYPRLDLVFSQDYPTGPYLLTIFVLQQIRQCTNLTSVLEKQHMNNTLSLQICFLFLSYLSVSYCTIFLWRMISYIRNHSSLSLTCWNIIPRIWMCICTLTLPSYLVTSF